MSELAERVALEADLERIDVEAVMRFIEANGYRILPVKMTAEMNEAGWRSEDHDGWKGPQECYRKILDAAPKVV